MSAFASVVNPLFLLDEIDKMGMTCAVILPARCSRYSIRSYNGHGFNDHYLEVDYDLSNVFFVYV